MSERPRVLYLSHTARMSGGEIALIRMLRGLRGGVDVLVVLAEDGPVVDALAESGVEVVVLPLGRRTRDLRKDTLGNPLAGLGQLLAVARYAWRLRAVIRRRRMHLVHTNSLKAGFYGCLAARLAGVPSVWHLRDRLASDYLPVPAILATRCALAALPRRVLVNSAATAQTTSSGPLRLRRPALVVPDPLDATEPADFLAPRSRDTFRVGMVGRMAPWKGQLIVLRAFAAADLPASSRLVLMGSAIFGEHDYEKEVKAEVGRLGLEDRVELAGFVPDVLTAIRDLDVLVHASTIPEPFGQVVVEGLASGVPVVATRQGGPGEIVTDGHDGVLYDAGDQAGLAAALRRLHDDPDLRARLRANGLLRARDFTTERIAPSILSVYEELLAGRRGPSR